MWAPGPPRAALLKAFGVSLPLGLHVGGHGSYVACSVRISTMTFAPARRSGPRCHGRVQSEPTSSLTTDDWTPAERCWPRSCGRSGGRRGARLDPDWRWMLLALSAPAPFVARNVGLAPATWLCSGRVVGEMSWWGKLGSRHLLRDVVGITAVPVRRRAP